MSLKPGSRGDGLSDKAPERDTTMIRLPRGKAVKENIDLAEVDLPAALKTLRHGRFTGYLLFDLTAGSSAVLLLCRGKVIAALYEDDHTSLTAGPGLDKTFLMVRRQGGRLNIYRLSEELARQLPVVLGGKALLQGELLQEMNVKAVLARMAREKRSGCLRVHSSGRVALIFYRDGRPLGFFHDGEAELDTNADISTSVAHDNDARLDVLVPVDGVLADLGDLMDDADSILP